MSADLTSDPARIQPHALTLIVSLVRLMKKIFVKELHWDNKLNWRKDKARRCSAL